MGATMAAGIDTFGMNFAFAAITLSAVYAGGTGGLEGLGDFAGGMIGSAYGTTVGKAVVGTFNTSYTQTEAQARERRISNMMEMLKKGQFENPTGNTNDGTSITLGNTEKANVIRDAAAKGAVGKGNNPTSATPSKTSSNTRLSGFQRVRRALAIAHAKIEIWGWKALRAPVHFAVEISEAYGPMASPLSQGLEYATKSPVAAWAIEQGLPHVDKFMEGAIAVWEDYLQYWINYGR